MSIKSHNYEENLVLSGRKNITESARNVISINLQSLLSNVIYYTKRRNSALVVCGVCVCVMESDNPCHIDPSLSFISYRESVIIGIISLLSDTHMPSGKHR